MPSATAPRTRGRMGILAARVQVERSITGGRCCGRHSLIVMLLYENSLRTLWNDMKRLWSILKQKSTFQTFGKMCVHRLLLDVSLIVTWDGSNGLINALPVLTTGPLVDPKLRLMHFSPSLSVALGELLCDARLRFSMLVVLW